MSTFEQPFVGATLAVARIRDAPFDPGRDKPVPYGASRKPDRSATWRDGIASALRLVGLGRSLAGLLERRERSSLEQRSDAARPVFHLSV